MAELFASGRVVDLVLVLMVLEGLVLAGLWQRRGQGVPPLRLGVNLAAGAAMLLALRGALTGVSWVWIWLPLLAALIAHGLDLALRWQGRTTPARPQNAGGSARSKTTSSRVDNPAE